MAWQDVRCLYQEQDDEPPFVSACCGEKLGKPSGYTDGPEGKEPFWKCRFCGRKNWFGAWHVAYDVKCEPAPNCPWCRTNDMTEWEDGRWLCHGCDRKFDGE